MKKTVVFLLLVLLVTALLCGVCAAETTVYVGSGETYTDLSSAFSALPNGGTVVLKSDITLGTSAKGVTLPATTGKVTVRGQTPDVKLTVARSLTLSGAVELDSLTLHSTATSSGNVLSNGNPLIIGAGVTTTRASGAMWLGLFGGASSGTKTYNTSLTVKAGTYRVIYGGSYGGTLNGTTSTTVSNVNVTGTLSGQNYQGTCNASTALTFDLRGGATVEAGTIRDGETPTVLTDDGYDYKVEDGVYSEYRTATSSTVYLDGTGATAGAFTAFADALEAVSDGGELILAGNTSTGAVTLPKKAITLSAQNGAVLTVSGDITAARGGKAIVWNIPVNAAAAVSFFGGWRDFTFGEAFTVTGGVAFYGGVLSSGEDAVAGNAYTVTVENGTFSAFRGGNRRGSSTDRMGALPEKVTVNIHGGTFNGSFCLSGMSILAGDAELNISGGTFNCPVYIVGGIQALNSSGAKASAAVTADRENYAADGDIAVNISGGTFTGGLISAYDTTYAAHTQLLRGNYTLTITGGDFADGTVLDATQVKAYAGETKTASVTYPQGYTFTTVRFDTVNGEARQDAEPLRVAFIGDSITEGYAPSGTTVDRLTQSYPAVFTSLCKENGMDIVVSNYGASASGLLPSTSIYYYDMLAYKLLMEETDADIYVIALGTNDSVLATSNFAKETYIRNYKQIVDDLAAKPDTEKIVFTSAIAYNYENYQEIRIASAVRPIEEALASEYIAEDAGKFAFVDLYGMTLAAAKAGNLLSSDNLHPNVSGYSVMGNAVYNALMNGAAAPTYKRSEIWLSEFGTPFGAGTKTDPTSRLDIALGMMENGADVTLHVVGNVSYGSEVDLSIAPKSLIVVGEGQDAVLTVGGNTLRLGCDTVFDNITLSAGTADFFANYHDFTLTASGVLAGNWSFYAGYGVHTEKAEISDTAATVSSDAAQNIDLSGSADLALLSLGNGRVKLGDYSGEMTVYLGERVLYTVGNAADGNTLSGSIAVTLPKGKTLAVAAGNTDKVTFTEYDPAPIPPCTGPHSYQDSVCVRCGYEYTADTAYYNANAALDGDGLTPATAFGSFVNAVRAVGKNGGRVILCSDLDLGSTDKGYTMPETTGTVIIDGQNSQTVRIYRTWILAGDLTLENLTLDFAGTAMANIYSYGHTFTVESSVTCTKSGSMWIAVFGGGGNDPLTTDTCLILRGGKWRSVYAGNYMNTLVGTTHLTLANAVVNGSINTGNYQGTHTGSGSVTVDLRGGATVSGGTWNVTPTVLVDDGYEYRLESGTYMQYKNFPDEPRTVYVDGTGNTPDAYPTLSAALMEMPGGGTVILSGSVEIGTDTVLPTSKPILITSVYGAEDYTRTAEIRLAASLILGGDTTFRDITFEKTVGGNLYLVAAGHALVIDEGVSCLNYAAGNNISIVGGNQTQAFTGDTHVTVKSGTWRNLFGGNYNGAFTGSTYITVSGGVFENAIVGGSYSGDFTGDTHLTVTGNASMPASVNPQGIVGATLGVDGGTARSFNGNVYLTLSGKAGISSNLFGGPRNNNITMHGDVEINIEGDPFVYFSTFGGGYTKGIDGSVHITVDGGELWGNLFGGSHAGNVTGDTLIEIHGGRLCAYKNNEFSGNSELPGTKNVFGGGEGDATVSGNTTVVMDGGTVYGDITAKTVRVENGIVFGKLSGGNVTVDLSQGGEVTLLDDAQITNLVGGGKLTLSSFASASVGTVSGNTTLAISGLPLPKTYITAATVADGAQIAYAAQEEETLVRTGNDFAVDFANSHKSVLLTVRFTEGMTCRLREKMLTSGSWAAPVSETATSQTFSVAPGFYTATVVSKTNNSDYRRYTVYVSGREAAKTLDAVFVFNDGSGNVMSQSRAFPEEFSEEYYSVDGLPVSFDTPYFNSRYGTPAEVIPTTNAELAAFMEEKAANCPYMYLFDLCTTPNGFGMPVAVFTMDEIPAGATFEEIAKIVKSKGDREILYFDGGVHGNEPSGSEGNLAFVSELCGAYGESVLSDAHIGAIIVQPRENPEGFVTSTRESLTNAVQNLNRDFMALTSAEVTASVYIDRVFTPSIAVDCHEALFVNLSGSGIQSDIYDIGIMAAANFGCGYVDGTAIVYGDREAAFTENDEFVRKVRTDLESYGIRTYWYNKDRSAVFGANSRAVNGAYSFVMETPGIVGGACNMPRRTAAHLMGLKSFVQIAIDGEGCYAAQTNAARRAVALSAQKYDGKTPVVIQHATSRSLENAYEWNDALLGIDGVARFAENPVYGFNYDIAMRYRTLPTAYVFPADTAKAAEILALLDRHGIAYTFLPAGTALTLSRYAGTTSSATLGAETSVTFATGAYIVPVDTARAYTIAYLFEPDNRDATDGSPVSVQMMELLPVTDTYRSTERFIAAKLGIKGTYTAIDIPEGKTVASVTVDGAVSPDTVIEDGKVFIAPADPESYSATVAYTDGTTFTAGLKGDTDGDGAITVYDALAVLHGILNKHSVANGDISGDGNLSLLDVLQLLKLAAE